ncbi:hypothetical protein [Priestia megaterium]|uniref:hypothetical protein n=1 Tax=Priestia megaterium TaxID=1404 RepID=UPI00112B2618|nr:hypothetical protein [Priestia megaterium]TPF18004.1 hypothetical protein CBE78_01910 [Priestia megaterium]TPF22111.1 hypothetical protein CBE79_04415 [Priestia megaterium]
MELVKNNKQEEITSIHNYNKKQQEKEEMAQSSYDIFLSEILPAMNKKEKYEVFYGNPSTERLEEIMEKVVVRAQIRKEILLEKLS